MTEDQLINLFSNVPINILQLQLIMEFKKFKEKGYY